MKKVLIVNQNKGGVGKSYLSALIFKKYVDQENFILVDIDSGNRSSYNRFQLNATTKNKVIDFTLLTADSNIDKDKFNDLFDTISKCNQELIVLDLGGNESREFLSLIEIYGSEVSSEYFKEKNLDVELLTVIKCNQSESIEFLKKSAKILKDQIPMLCFVNANSFDGEDDLEYKNLKSLCKVLNLDLKIFGKAPSGGIRDRISKHVDSGFNTDLHMSKGLFTSMVQALDI